MSRPALMAPGRNSSGLPGAWRCTGRNNEEMVDKFVHVGVITSKEVEEAFRAVPRGAFVPPGQQLEAYFDSPLRGEPHVHMSAPHMYATVLEALDLSPGRRVCSRVFFTVKLYVPMSLLLALHATLLVSKLK